MSRNNPARGTGGFTLVEMLVIAPIALLVIAGFIALMITMTGDILVSSGRNGMTHDIQGSLDMIEQDVRLSTEFLATTGTMPSPQGKDGATASFNSTSGDLILGEIATTKSPIDPARSFVYYNTPNSCTDSQKYKNRIFFTTVMYFVKNGSLWRRTFVPSPSGTLCDTPWQVNTCAPGYASTATQCKTNDTEVMKNVSSFTVSYYATSSDTTALAAGSAPSASTINVQINGQQNIAGRTLSATASGRSTKLSSKDIALAPPGIPTVTAQAYDPNQPGTATFTWTANPLVTYSVRYNVNGGAWITAADSTSVNSITLTGSRADTITVQVAARNTTGSSGFGGGASLTLPSWESCVFYNNWQDYGGGHATCGFTKTTDGVVVVKGLVKINATAGPVTDGQTIFILPPGYRPANRIIFQGSTYDTTNTSGVRARVDVDTGGNVRIKSPASTGWVSLSDINFIPAGSLYGWTSVSLSNNWVNYGDPYPPLEVTKDNTGRVHMSGLVQPGSTTSTTLATLPSGYAPSEYLHLPSFGSTQISKRIAPTGAVLTSSYGSSSTYYSMEAMYYPSSFSGWSNLTMQNGWTAFDASYYATPQYTRAADCIVTVKGLIKNTTAPNGVTVATLPAGYRPKQTLIFSGVSSDAYYRLQILNTGAIQLIYADTYWVSLNNINFVADDGSPCPQ